MLLGRLGAQVISVEPPRALREESSLDRLEGHGDAASRRLGTSPLFSHRRSLVVDLKSAVGVSIIKRMVPTVDIFLEGFRPGVIERLDLGYETLSSINTGLVYCSITGFGQSGPSSQTPGHDLTYLAESGILSAATRPGQKPGIPLNALADFSAGGLLAAFGVMAALHERTSSGRGAFVDVSMYQGLLLMASHARDWIESIAEDNSWGGGLLTGEAPFYDCYLAKDERWVAVAALEPKFFRRFCSTLGLDDLTDSQNDRARWPEMRVRFSDAIGSRNSHETLALLKESDVTVAPVLSLTEAFEEAVSRGVVGDAFSLGPVPRFDAFSFPPVDRSPLPGADTCTILRNFGFSALEIREFLSDGVVEQAES